MVESGQPIRRVDFDSRLDARLPVEVVERREVIGRMGPTHLGAPQRVSFDVVMLMGRGRGSHMVDFAEIPAQEGRMLRLRPGQIQSWNVEADFDAIAVLSQPAVLPGSPWFPGDRIWRDLDRTEAGEARSLIGMIQRRQGDYDGEPATHRLLATLFTALVALFDDADGGADGDLPEVYVAFRTAIEADIGKRHDIVGYARELGYSARTISRACQRVNGQTAKQVLTDRLVLEAKRLLVHTDTPIAGIGAQLGFTEATNFTKFFTRNAGLSPQRFRSHHPRTESSGTGTPARSD